jgi:hypothetical protein
VDVALGDLPRRARDVRVRVGGQRDGPDRHVVGLDVVGVAVGAVLVVGDDHVGTLGPEIAASRPPPRRGRRAWKLSGCSLPLGAAMPLSR